MSATELDAAMDLLDIVIDTTKARAEIVALRAAAEEREADGDKYCPLCTWRGSVELVNGVCPQCDVDWPKAYREYRDALTVAKERITEQARQLEQAREFITADEFTWCYIGTCDICDRKHAWLAATAPEGTEK